MKNIVLVLMLMATYGAIGQIERVEPPNWWAGMKGQELQLMVYGKEIAQYQVTSPNLSITQTIRTENPNYVFVDIATQGVAPGSYSLIFSKNGKEKFSYDYRFEGREVGSANRKGFDSSDVMYLIMPDRFANGDTDNDSHPDVEEKVNRNFHGGRHGGDLQGVIDHLDYLEDLGVTAIWSTPLLEDNDAKYSYHTYAQSDVYRIDPRFGTNEDYKRLADEMHQRDMKLVMDYVTNHWGITHWMMEDLPTYNWIHQFPGYANSNYRMTTQYDPNTSQHDKHYCVDGWFVPTMPDLNQSNPLVLRYLTQNAIWWIEYAGLDGFRVDTYSYNDKEGIAAWTKAIMAEYPNFNIVGEVWLHNQAQIAYWQKDSKIGALQQYNTGLPSVMDFTLHDAIMAAFGEEDQAWDKGMVRVYENMVNDFLYPDIDNILVFAENHDTPRINELYPELEDYKLIMTLLATVRGIPQLYYGSEIGMKGDKSVGDGDIRRDFPGGWPGDSNNAFTQSGRTAEQASYFNFTKKLLNWRKEKAVVHKGSTVQFVPVNNVYVFARELEGETILVVLNNNTEKQALKMERFAEVLGDRTEAQEVLSGKLVALDKEMEVPAKTALILELE